MPGVTTPSLLVCHEQVVAVSLPPAVIDPARLAFVLITVTGGSR